MSTTVAVIGPNLYDQSKGQFHVHTAECRDGKNGRKYPLQNRHELEVDSKLDVALDIYDWMDDDEVRDEVGEFYFHACVSDLPDETPAATESTEVTLSTTGPFNPDTEWFAVPAPAATSLADALTEVLSATRTVLHPSLVEKLQYALAVTTDLGQHRLDVE